MCDQEATMTAAGQELLTITHLCDTQAYEVVDSLHTVLDVEVSDAATELLDPVVPKANRASIIW